MKSRREHRVPLTPEAVALLEGLPRLTGASHVFFGPGGGALSDMALPKLMRGMHEADLEVDGEGYFDPRSKRPAVPHGLRSTFRQWAAERGFDFDMAEMALAHRVYSATARAFQRSDMLERRRAMLDEWGRELRGESTGTVVELRGDAAERHAVSAEDGVTSCG